MARLARLSVANESHYVVLNAQSDVSLIPLEEDVDALFGIFSEIVQSHPMVIQAYAVMPEQIHLLVSPKEKAENLSIGVQQISRLYSRYFNEAYSRSGTIWKGRFQSSLIQGEGKVLKATIFMEHLPLKFGFGEPYYYPWTSYFHHGGYRSDFFLSSSPDYWALGNTPFERQKHYKEIFSQGVSQNFGDQILKAIKRGWPIADPSFLEEHDIPVGRQRPLNRRGRPKKQPEID